MALFSDSSQARQWMFSREQLSIIRSNAAEAGADGVGKLVVPEEEESADPGTDVAVTPMPRGPRPPMHTFMTPGFGNLSLRTPIQQKSRNSDLANDQQTLIKYFICRIPQVCAQLQLPVRVEASAMVYVQRFYLKHSVRHHNPKNIMLAAIFLAGKVEEAHVVAAEEYATKMGITENVLKSSEVVLLNALEYHLVVFHPFRSMRGLLAELDKEIPEERQSLAIVGSKATQLITWSLATDACFVYAPGQIATAAVLHALIELEMTKIDVSMYLKKLENGDSVYNMVEKARKEVFEGLEAPEVVAQALAGDATGIDRSLRTPVPSRRQLIPPTPLTSASRRRRDDETIDTPAKRSKKE